jgi:plastocyanin
MHGNLVGRSLATLLFVGGIILAGAGGVRATTGRAAGAAERAQPIAPAQAVSTPVSEDETTIWMRSDLFYHDYVFVPVGTTITWVNAEPDPTDDHNVLADDGSFTSPIIRPGESWSFTFTTPGYYHYGCELHDGMEGAVLVEE